MNTPSLTTNVRPAACRFLLVGVLGVLLAGCGRAPTSMSSATPPAVVPWLPRPTSNVYPQLPSPSPSSPIPVPAGTPPCSAAQLEAVSTVGGHVTGHTGHRVILRNRGASDCTLEGYADVSIVDAAGGRLAAAVGASGRGTFFNDGPLVQVLLVPGTAALPTGAQEEPVQRYGERGQAWMNLEWYDCRHPQAARVLVDLPDGGGRLTAPFAFQAPYSPVCDWNGAYSGLSRGPISPSGFDRPPHPVGILAAITIAAPASIHRGSTLRYTVTIVNRGTVEYRLSPCPDYIEILGLKESVAAYQLNCAPVGVIQPAGSATFEMRLAAPRTLAPGATRLEWGLLDGRLATSGATTTVTVL